MHDHSPHALIRTASGARTAPRPAMRRGGAFAAATLLLCTFLAGQESQFGIYHPINDLALGAGPAGVVLNGSMLVNAPDLQVVVHATPQNVPTGVEADFTIRGGLTLEVTADAGGSFDGKIPVGVVPLPAFQLGPTILVVPYAQLSARIHGEAEAGMRVSFVQEFEFGVGFDIGPGFSMSTSQPGATHRFGQPELTGESAASLTAEVLAGVAFQITWNGIFVGGPIAGAAFGVDLDVDPTAPRWWTLTGHVAPYLGWNLGVSEVKQLPGYEFPIASADVGLTAVDTRWSEAVHVDGTETLRAVAPTAAGLLAVARSSGDRPWIARLDREGQLLAAQRGDAAPFASQRPVTALPMGGGEVIVVGHAAGETQPRIDRVDAAGNVLWTRQLVHPTAPILSVAGAVALPDGDFVVAGTATTVVPAGSFAWMARFAPDGQQRFAVDVQSGSGITQTIVKALVRCANGDLVLAGAADFQEWDGSNLVLNLGNVWLARLDESGVLGWASAAGTVAGEQANCVTEAADGSLVLGATIHDGGSHWAGLYTFEANGAFRRAVAYHGDRTGVVGYDVMAVAATEGGIYVLGGVDPGPGRDAFLAMVSDSGSVLWWKTIGGTHEDEPLGLAALPDGLVAWGSTLSPDNLGSGTGRDGWIVRTDVDGMLHFENGNGFDAHNDDVWWQRWNLAVAATSLAPSAVPVTLTTSTPPLTLSASTGQITVLTDG